MLSCIFNGHLPRNRGRSTAAACAVIAVASAFGGCTTKGSQDAWVAKVGDRAISQQTYDHWLRISAALMRPPGVKQINIPDPPRYTHCSSYLRRLTKKSRLKAGDPPLTPAQARPRCQEIQTLLRSQVLPYLIAQAWIEGEAKQEGVALSDAEASHAVAQAKRRDIGNKQSFRAFLARSTMSPEDYASRARLDVLFAKIRAKHTPATVSPSTAEVRAYWIGHRHQFDSPKDRGKAVPFDRVEPQVRQYLIGQQREKAFSPFVTAFQRRWRLRTTCRRGYVIPGCKNAPASAGAPVGAPSP